MASFTLEIAALEEVIAEVKRRLPDATHLCISPSNSYYTIDQEFEGPIPNSQSLQVFATYTMDAAGGLFSKSIPYKVNASSWEEGRYATEVVLENTKGEGPK